MQKGIDRPDNVFVKNASATYARNGVQLICFIVAGRNATALILALLYLFRMEGWHSFFLV